MDKDYLERLVDGCGGWQLDVSKDDVLSAVNEISRLEAERDEARRERESALDDVERLLRRKEHYECLPHPNPGWEQSLDGALERAVNAEAENAVLKAEVERLKEGLRWIANGKVSPAITFADNVLHGCTAKQAFDAETPEDMEEFYAAMPR